LCAARRGGLPSALRAGRRRGPSLGRVRGQECRADAARGVPEPRRVLRQALPGLGWRRRGRAGEHRARRARGDAGCGRARHGLGGRAAAARRWSPPLFYVAMRPWTWLPFRGAALAWLALGQGLLLATAALLLRRRAVEPARLVALLAMTALFQPLVETLHLGQANVLVLALMTVGWWGARNARPWLAAVALGLALHVKPQFGLPIVALAWIGQRGIAYRAAAVAAAGLGAGAVTVGPAAYLD